MPEIIIIDDSPFLGKTAGKAHGNGSFPIAPRRLGKAETRRRRLGRLQSGPTRQHFGSHGEADEQQSAA